MELVLIIGLIVVVSLLLRPAPRSQTIFVPIEVARDHRSGGGCLTPVLIVILVFVMVTMSSR
jgi:hypothetical protein